MRLTPPRGTAPPAPRRALSEQRRIVRVGESFFDQLDEQLGPDRGPRGEPSATAFDALAEIVAGQPRRRFLLSAGVLTNAVAVYGILLDDASIELVGIELDLP